MRWSWRVRSGRSRPARDRLHRQRTRARSAFALSSGAAAQADAGDERRGQEERRNGCRAHGKAQGRLPEQRREHARHEAEERNGHGELRAQRPLLRLGADASVVLALSRAVAYGSYECDNSQQLIFVEQWRVKMHGCIAT